MNWRQSAKAAEKVIKGLEEQIDTLMHYKKMATADIQDYNKCILGMISGDSPCLWCEDREECQLDAKEAGKGCSEWLLMFHHEPDTEDQEPAPFQIDAVGGDDDEGERVFSSGQKG